MSLPTYVEAITMSESQKRNKLADLLFLGGTLSAAALLANYSPGGTEAVPLRDGQAIQVVNQSAEELQKGAQAVEDELKRQALQARLECKTTIEGEARPAQIRGRYKSPRVPRRVTRSSNEHPNPAGGMRPPRLRNEDRRY